MYNSPLWYPFLGGGWPGERKFQRVVWGFEVLMERKIGEDGSYYLGFRVTGLSARI